MSDNRVEDSLEVPKWLDNSFLQNVICKFCKNDSIKIESFVIEPVTARGENYASILYRVKSVYSSASDKVNFINFFLNLKFN